MAASDFNKVIEDILAEKIDPKVKLKSLRNLAGGCINNALKAETTRGNFFIKYNHHDPLALFEAEAKGLQLLRDAHAIHIPEVLAWGDTGKLIYFIQEFIEPASRRKDYWEDFGRSLANLHKETNPKYGLSFNNFIGSLPQINEWQDNWISFFIEMRLQPQLKLARDSGKVNNDLLDSFERLFKKLPDLLIIEKPSLLHGDLWSGNVMINQQGKAALVDPAVYYGNREIELALTHLFGGFDQEFYNSYLENFSLEKGYENRWDIYNLYPLLVHVNLFGEGYLSSVVNILKRYS